jgi:hypothetical protein
LLTGRSLDTPSGLASPVNARPKLLKCSASHCCHCLRPKKSVSRAKMTWRTCVRQLPLSSVPGRAPRQFSSFYRPTVARINNAVIVPVGRSALYNSPVARRGFFGIGRKRTETSSGAAVKAAKSFGRVFYRFAVYSTIFIAITVSGFFIYDVFFPLSGSCIFLT